MVKTFLADCGISAEQIDRIAWLVGHHHTFHDIEGMDCQILIKADFIANASENEYNWENVTNFMNKIMKTAAGNRLARAIFCL